MKTNIKRLDSLSHNDTAATKLINDNFAALQQGIEDSLSRTGKTPNFMDAELDMNSRRIINVGEAIDDTDVVSYGTYKKHIGQAISAAQSAASSANNAKNSAVEARQYARQARDARDEAVAGLNDVNTAVDEGMMNISDLVEDGKKTLTDIVEDYYTKEEIDAKSGESRRYPVTFLTTTWKERVGDYTGEYIYVAGISSWIEDASKYNGAVLTFSEEDAVSGIFSPVFEWTQGELNQGNNRVSIVIFAKEIPDHNVTVEVTFIH